MLKFLEKNRKIFANILTFDAKDIKIECLKIIAWIKS